MHIVHIKEPYGSLAEAEHDLAGIALLAFLFEVKLWDVFASIVTVNTDWLLTFLMFFSPCRKQLKIILTWTQSSGL